MIECNVHLHPRWQSGEDPACQCRETCGFDPWIGKIPWRSKWQTIPVFMPGKLHGRRILAGYSPWGCKESDMIEHACTPSSPKYGFINLLQVESQNLNARMRNEAGSRKGDPKFN